MRTRGHNRKYNSNPVPFTRRTGNVLINTKFISSHQGKYLNYNSNFLHIKVPSSVKYKTDIRYQNDLVLFFILVSR